MSLQVQSTTSLPLVLSVRHESVARVSNDNALVHFPSLPSITDAFRPFKQFMSQNRQFKGCLDSFRKNAIIERLKSDNCVHLEEFLQEPILQQSDFFVETSYQAILDAVHEVYQSYTQTNDVYFRGGSFRDQFHLWLRECFCRLYPNEHETKPEKAMFPPPDIDIMFDASGLTMDQIHEIEKAIFHHLAKKMAANKPHLEEAYFTLASLCCYARRKDLYMGGEYTLTTLQCMDDSPDLEVIIFKRLERRYLCRLDKLSLRLYDRKVQCNDGQTSEESIWQVVFDIIHYYLTIDHPEKVDGLGFARIMTHIVSGGRLQGERTFQRLYENNERKATELESASLVKKFMKSCKDHLKSRRSALAAMCWNFYAFTGFKDALFYSKACEHKMDFGFQAGDGIHAIQAWILHEMKNNKSDVKFECVEFEGGDWLRVRQYGLYWFIPEFEISDDDLIKMLLTAKNIVPAKIVQQRFPGVNVWNQPLPIALIQMPQPIWHTRALALFERCFHNQKIALAGKMISRGHTHSFATLIQLYKKLAPNVELFFALVAKLRGCCSHNTTMQAEQLAHLSFALPRCAKKKKREDSVKWLVQHCGSVDLAGRVFVHLQSMGYIQAIPDDLVERSRLDTCSPGELMDNPLFCAMARPLQIVHLRHALARESSHLLDSSLYRCFRENWIDYSEARSIFSEHVSRFSYVTIHWVVELYGELTIPIELFKTIPFEAARALSYRLPIGKEHFAHLVENVLLYTEMEMHKFLHFHFNFVKLKLFPTSLLIQLAMRLIHERKFEEALFWIVFILEQSVPLNGEVRKEFLRCCMLMENVERAADLALTFRDAPAGSVHQSVIHELFDHPKLGFIHKLALAQYFDIKSYTRWTQFVESSPADQRIVDLIRAHNKRGILSNLAMEILLIEELWLLLSETSSPHFLICLNIMSEYPNRVTHAHKQKLLKLVPQFIRNPSESQPIPFGGHQVDPNEFMIFTLGGILRNEQELLAELILILAGEDEYPVFQDMAFHFLKDNAQMARRFAPKMLCLAAKWKTATPHDAALGEMANYTLSGKSTTRELIPAVRALIAIKTPSVQVACAKLFTKHIPALDDLQQEWFALIVDWLEIQFADGSPAMGDDQALCIIDVIKTTILSFTNEALETKLCRCMFDFTKARIRRQGNAPIDDITGLFSIMSINCLVHQIFHIRNNEALFREFAENVIEVFGAFVRHPEMLFDDAFKLVWEFLTYTKTNRQLVALMDRAPPCVMDSDKVAFSCSLRKKDADVKDVVVADVHQREAVEVEVKAKFFRAIYQALELPNKNAMKLLIWASDYLCILGKRFKNHGSLIFPLLHQYVFPQRDVYDPKVSKFRQAKAAALMPAFFRQFEARTSKICFTELNFYFTLKLQSNASKDESSRYIMAMLMRFISMNHPFWLFKGYIHIPNLEGMLTPKEFIDFSHKAFTAAGVALGNVQGPFIEDSVLVTTALYNEFSKSILIKNQNQNKSTSAAKTEAFRSILEGASRFARRFASLPEYSFIMKDLLVFMSGMLNQERFQDAFDITLHYYGELLKIAEDFPLSMDALVMLHNQISKDTAKITHESKMEMKADLLKRSSTLLMQQGREAALALSPKN